MQVRIEGFGMFDTSDDTARLAPKVFEHLTEKTSLTEMEIHLFLLPTPGWKIASKGGKIMGVPK